MREILTLQFGHFANFIGTHYWNTQESYFSSVQNENDILDVDHDILFRTGQNPQGHETYTPRLLLFDLKGGFGSLPQHNELYSAGPEVESKTAWQHQVEKHEQPAYSKNEYLQSLDVEHSLDAPRHYHNLDNTVNVWSDYNKLYYHPKSINTLNGFFHGDENAPFDIFSSGRDSFFEENWNEQAMEDHFRFFVEECDQLQGFQMFANMTDAFGGLATMFLEDLRDDFPKTPVMVYGFTDTPVNRLTVDNPKSILNVSFSTRMMNEYSSLYIPLILPTPTDLDPSHRTRFLRADLSLPYHSSSILAAAVETATLQFRTKHNPTMMGDFIDRLNWRQNTKVARLCTGFPLPVVHGHGKEILHSVFTGHKFGQTRDFMWDLSTREKPGSDDLYFSQMIAARGLRPGQDFVKSMNELRLENKSESEQDALDQVGRHFSSTRCQRTSSVSLRQKFPVSDAFPHIFNLNVQEDGSIDENRHRHTPTPDSVSHVIHISTSSLMSSYFKTMIRQLNTLNYHLYTHLYDREGLKGGVSMDDFKELKEWCEEIAEDYQSE